MAEDRPVTGMRLLRQMLPDLPNRQWQVLELRVMGMQAKEVGYVLGMSPKTVATYTNIIFEKFGVDSVIDLVHLCYLVGAIQFHEIDREKLAMAMTSREQLVSRSNCSAALPRSLRPTLSQLGADS